ncbi:MAG: TatD family hydrolase [Nanoarchaeota archaeon]|nr:TatD family hydrolase [Nanoarchaeota archaeon]
MLVDVHAHLDCKSFNNDLDEVIKRAKNNNVIKIISNGVNPESNRKVLELARKYDIVKPALGIYPIDSLKMSEEEIDDEIAFIKKSKPLAIGEIGLDLHHTKELSKQKEVFEKFLKLAEELRIPAIIHTRKAEKQIIETLETTKLKKIVLHTFMGKLKLAKRAEDHGCYFSIPPIINHSSQLQGLAKQISISRLLTETDSPFLSHDRGQRNEPMNVKVVVKKIAEVKCLVEKEVENLIFMNYKNLF